MCPTMIWLFCENWNSRLNNIFLEQMRKNNRAFTANATISVLVCSRQVEVFYLCWINTLLYLPHTHKASIDNTYGKRTNQPKICSRIEVRADDDNDNNVVG